MKFKKVYVTVNLGCLDLIWALIMKMQLIQVPVLEYFLGPEQRKALHPSWYSDQELISAVVLCAPLLPDPL